MTKTHQFQVSVKWTGDRGQGTADYRSYSREHEVGVDGKHVIEASSDPAFRGDVDRYNPEELFVSAIATCHMLWYLHLCADAGVVVVGYSDEARGVMEEGAEGGKFVSVTLYPKVLVTEESMTEKALALHEQANQLCYIANSLNFKVGHKPRCDVR